MLFAKNEKKFGQINDAVRKGKGAGEKQSPCSIGVATLKDDPDTIIVRTEDASGTPPIIVCLNKDQAKRLITMLVRAL